MKCFLGTHFQPLIFGRNPFAIDVRSSAHNNHHLKLFIFLRKICDFVFSGLNQHLVEDKIACSRT